MDIGRCGMRQKLMWKLATRDCLWGLNPWCHTQSKHVSATCYHLGHKWSPRLVWILVSLGHTVTTVSCLTHCWTLVGEYEIDGFLWMSCNTYGVWAPLRCLVALEESMVASSWWAWMWVAMLWCDSWCANGWLWFCDIEMSHPNWPLNTSCCQLNHGINPCNQCLLWSQLVHVFLSCQL